jgi:hypothetical protein
MNPDEILQSTFLAKALKSESTRERITVRGCRSATATVSSTRITNDAVEAASSCFVGCIVVILAGGLHEIQRDGR